MLRREDLHPYQRRAVEFLDTQLPAALHLDCGLGKTPITLTAIADWLDQAIVHGVLIIAPRRVAESVWVQEIAKWEHLHHLRAVVLRGRKKEKLARELLQPHQIFVINYEALPWLVDTINELFLRHGRYPPFDAVVFDELTRVKNPEGTRITALQDILPYCQDKRIGLTGTPAPNGYWDLQGEYLALDGGHRLGGSQRIWKEMFFIDNPYTRRRTLAPGAKGRIEGLIADMTLSMTDTDYLDLPEFIYNEIAIDLPVKVRKQYDEFEAEMFTEFDHGDLEVFNAAALTNKCRQIANGSIIDTENAPHYFPVHEAKLEAMDSIMEEAAGQPVLCAYIFRSDMDRIVDRYRKRGYNVAYFGPGISDAEGVGIVDGWNRGDYDLLVTHAKSAGHGLNIQFSGHQVVWFGLDWNLEEWMQLNARLRRQGQKSKHVIIHMLLAVDTLDYAVKDALESKASDQAGLRAAMEAYRRRVLRY